MKNRIFLTLTAATLAISLLSAGACAEELIIDNEFEINAMAKSATLTIDNFEADTECITIYPGGDTSVSELEGTITLKENGETVAFTVEEVKTHDSNVNAFDYTANTNFSQAKSYKVKKQGGFSCDTSYFIDIAAANYSKSFVIEEILSDDFSNDTSKWTLAQESGNSVYWGSNTMEIVDGALQVTTGAACSYLHPLLPANFKNMVNLEDYTIQFDIRSLTALTGSDYYFKFGLTTNGVMPTIGSKDEAKYSVRADKYMSVQMMGGASTWVEDATVDEANATFKMVAKDNRNVLFADGIKFADWTSNSYDAKGVFGISFQKDNAVYEIDNVIMTRVVEAVQAEVDKAEYDISDEVIVTLSNAYDTTALDKKLITVSEVEGFEVAPIDEYSFKLTFTSPLEYKTKYTISISEDLPAVGMTNYKYGSVSFTTIPPAFDLESFKNDNGTLKAVLKNNREADGVSCIATIVMYDADNKMIGINGGVKSIALGEDDDVTLAVDSNAATAKCYIWDSFSGLNTIFEETIVIK